MVDIQTGITIGQALLVRYQGYDLWHERVPLARVNRYSSVVVTPELDVYSGQLMMPPLSGMRFMAADRLLPLGLDENNVHRFSIRNRPNGYLTDDDIARLKIEAQVLARSVRDYLPNIPMVPFLWDPVAPVCSFSLSEDVGGHARGMQMFPRGQPGDIVMAGNSAIIALSDGIRVPCVVRAGRDAAPVLPLAGGAAGAGPPAGPELAGHGALRARLAGGQRGALQGPPPEVIMATQKADPATHDDVLSRSSSIPRASASAPSLRRRLGSSRRPSPTGSSTDCARPRSTSRSSSAS